ncbi:MAG: PKD domain-containing protein [Bacteroidales bacterium]|nr:PKD domain-containing protein [Bacteroidales bacterium]
MKRPLIYIIILLLAAAWTSDIYGQAKGSYEVTLMSAISNTSDDIAPVIVEDGILFCSNRKENPFLTRKNFDGVRLYDLYFAPFNNEGEPGRAHKFTTGLGKKTNIGPAYLSPDGNTLWFTRNYVEGGKLKRDQANNLGIFTARRQGSGWTDITPFIYNDPAYNLSYPFVSSDGRYLFFSSDMPGTRGKYDIFMCENVAGEWSKPVNLGDNVNTADAEIHPFLHNSGRLYFASDRSGGLGGLDIYYSVSSFGSWSKPQTLSDPINSEADDFAFYSSPSGQEGYFSSNRRRYSDDIYRYATTIIRWSACDTLQKNSYCYEFVEEKALESDTMGLKFKWEWNFGDGTKAEGIITEHCYGGPGVYDVSLDIVNLIPGGIEKRQASYELEIADIEQPVIASANQVFVDEVFSLSGADTYLPGMKIARYYWNFGDETEGEGVNVSKSYPVTGRYNIQLIVSSEPGAGGVIREVCVCKDIVVVSNGN